MKHKFIINGFGRMYKGIITPCTIIDTEPVPEFVSENELRKLWMHLLPKKYFKWNVKKNLSMM